MLEPRERIALESARVGRLATADEAGRPHVVPVCYAVVDADASQPVLITPIDRKPKSAGPRALRRVRDIEINPSAAVVVDRYDDDWDRLWWVQIRGTAAVVEPDETDHGAWVDALENRYEQYRDHDLEDRPVIALPMRTVRSWGALPQPEG